MQGISGTGLSCEVCILRGVHSVRCAYWWCGVDVGTCRDKESVWCGFPLITHFDTP